MVDLFFFLGAVFEILGQLERLLITENINKFIEDSICINLTTQNLLSRYVVMNINLTDEHFNRKSI